MDGTWDLKDKQVKVTTLNSTEIWMHVYTYH